MPLKAIIHSSKYINLRKITTLLRKKSSGMAKKRLQFYAGRQLQIHAGKKAKLRKFATLKATVNKISRAGGENTKGNIQINSYIIKHKSNYEMLPIKTRIITDKCGNLAQEKTLAPCKRMENLIKKVLRAKPLQAARQRSIIK